MIGLPSSLPVPGALWGHYPENREPWCDRPVMTRRIKRLVAPLQRPRGESSDARFVAAVRARGTQLRALDDRRLAAVLHLLRGRLLRDGLPATVLIEALACVAEYARRRLGIDAYDVQLLAARIVVNGELAEMATGEGKTLAVALAAACGALAGMPVHVMTANDYLVVRDAQSFTRLYAALGLNVGIVTAETEPDARRAAYACDITYCTAKELVFDYLRDGQVRQRQPLRWHTDRALGGVGRQTVLRGLCMGIVDEADSILVDEARVPLILAQAEDNPLQAAYLRQALALARGLKAETDYCVDRNQHNVTLTAAGGQRVERAAGWLNKEKDRVWRNRLHRESVVTQALVALHVFCRDRDYLVDADGVHIIDPTTGRLAPGRAWSQGLHQLVELKEGCKPTAPANPLASITYQRFFPRYYRLGGLSGTLAESASELLGVYGLPVRAVALRKPSRRRVLPARLYADHTQLWTAVVDRVRELRRAGRPVLVGTESVTDSDALAAALTAAEIPHVVLNARNDADEAAIVACAGAAGQVTVATNMAGRGTDIMLAADVVASGGLHVINCQLNNARRIDRQLVGRCARQGDPGSVETWLSLDSRLLREHCAASVRRWLARATPLIASRRVALIVGALQRRVERQEFTVRQRLLEQDRHLDRKLAFA